jgi:hypothetical protein
MTQLYDFQEWEDPRAKAASFPINRWQECPRIRQWNKALNVLTNVSNRPDADPGPE